MKKHTTFQLFLMIVVVGMLNVDQNIIGSTLGLIEKEFHINDANIGMMTMVFTVVGAAISLLWGYFSDKSNRKLLFTLSVLIGQIPCLLTAFATNYTQFFIFRILTGIGLGASFPVVFSMLGDMYDERHRATAVTLMTTVMGVGQIAGPSLGGFIGPLYGWRLPFILASVPNLVFLLLFYIFVHEPKRGAGEDQLKDMVEAGYIYPRTIKLSDYVHLFQVKTNIFLIAQGILGMIPWGAIPLFLVKFLNEHKGLSIQDAALVFMLFGAGNVIGTVVGGEIGGILMKRKAVYLPRFCVFTNLVGTTLTLILFAVLPPGNMFSFLAVGFLASCLISVTGPNVRTMVLDTNVPENRGAIFSIFNLTDSVGAGIGPFFAGIFSVLVGLKMAMIVSVCVWFPCIILMWVCTYFFTADIQKLHQKINVVAEEMSHSKSSPANTNSRTVPM